MRDCVFSGSELTVLLIISVRAAGNLIVTVIT